MATTINLHPPFPVDADNFEALRTIGTSYDSITDSEVVNKAQLEDRLHTAQMSITGPDSDGVIRTYPNVSSISFVNAISDGVNNEPGEVVVKQMGTAPYGTVSLQVKIYTTTPAAPQPTIADFLVDNGHDVTVPAGMALTFTWTGVTNTDAMNLLYGTTVGTYTNTVPIPNPTFPAGVFQYTLPNNNVSATQYYFALQAINNSDGKMATSNPVGVLVETHPSIASFTASPNPIAAGGTSTLSWTLGGDAPTSLILTPGNINVLGQSSYNVSPTTTTTYVLTATNAVGFDTAQVTVTVGQGATLAITNNTFAGGGNSKAVGTGDSDIVATANVVNGTLSVAAGDTVTFGATTVTYPNFNVNGNVIRVPASALSVVENTVGFFTPNYTLTVTPTVGATRQLSATGSQFNITAAPSPTLSLASNTFTNGGNTKTNAAPDSDIVATFNVANATFTPTVGDTVTIGGTTFTYNQLVIDTANRRVTIPAALLATIENTVGSFQPIYNLTITATVGGAQSRRTVNGLNFSITAAPVLQAGFVLKPLSLSGNDRMISDSDLANINPNFGYTSTAAYDGRAFPLDSSVWSPTGWGSIFIDSDTLAAHPTWNPQYFEPFTQTYQDWNLDQSNIYSYTYEGKTYRVFFWDAYLAFSDYITRVRFGTGTV